MHKTKEPLKIDGMQGDKEVHERTARVRSETKNLASPVLSRASLSNREPYEAVRRGGTDEVDAAKRDFQRFPKTITILLLLLGISLFGSMPVAYAEDPPTAAPETPAAPGIPDKKGGFDLKSLRLNNKEIDPKKVQGGIFTERAREEKISVIAAIALEMTEFLTKVIGSVSFLVLIIAGIWMIVSTGNEQQITRAKGMFTYAILGLVISLAAYVLVIAVQGLLTE